MLSNSNPRVAIIKCPDFDVMSRKRGAPLGAAAIKKALAMNGTQSVLIEPRLDSGLRDGGIQGIVDNVRALGVEAVGISAESRTPVLNSVLTLSASLKAAIPGIPIVVGGYVSLLGKEVLERTNAIDVLFCGEGEERAPQVFNALLGSKISDIVRDNLSRLLKIPGLYIRQLNGEIFHTGEASTVKDLDRYVPDSDDLIGPQLRAGPYKEEDKKAYIYSSRGCYANCSFCDIIEMIGKDIRAVSNEKLREVIAELARKGIRVIEFYDDDFLFRSGRLREIYPVLMEHNITIDFQTRAQDVIRSIDEIRECKEVIRFLDMGIESFVNDQLRRWKKGATANSNLRAINLLAEQGIRYRCYLIMVDDVTTTQELQTNIQHFFGLPPSVGRIPYFLGTLTDQYSNARPLADLRGNSKISPALKRFVIIMGLINKLTLDLDYAKVSTKNDELANQYKKAILLSAQAMHILAVKSSIDSQEGEKTEDQVRRLIREYASAIGTFYTLSELGNPKIRIELARELASRSFQIISEAVERGWSIQSIDRYL